jgi:hypothetical protein
MPCGEDEDGVEIICARCGCKHEPYPGFSEQIERQKLEDERKGYERNYLDEEFRSNS